ncbi:Protein of unknown function [Lactobacillus delbrueckii subsp. lactis]|nr:Protein of unknown function [Lactobacillus delbrueckii subsp. lactis]
MIDDHLPVAVSCS